MWSLLTINSPSHLNGPFNVSLLRRLVAAQQKQINHLTTASEINAIARAKMNAHFRNPFAHGLTITKISKLGRPDAMNDAGTAQLVFQCREPSVKLIRTLKAIQAVKCIQLDTKMQ